MASLTGNPRFGRSARESFLRKSNISCSFPIWNFRSYHLNSSQIYRKSTCSKLYDTDHFSQSPAYDSICFFVFSRISPFGWHISGSSEAELSGCRTFIFMMEWFSDKNRIRTIRIPSPKSTFLSEHSSYGGWGRGGGCGGDFHGDAYRTPCVFRIRNPDRSPLDFP